MGIEWKKQKIKYLAHILNGKEIVEEVEEGVESAVDVYGSGGIFKYTNQHIYDGEAVLFGRKGTIGKPMYVEGKFWTVDTMFYVDCFNIEPKFLYYALTIFPWDYHTKTTTLPSIVGSDIANSKIAFPSDLVEQKRISNYLDHKIEQIDRVNATLHDAITKLEQTKKSIISECVTKGINKSVSLKDSGVAWIGKIPQKWKMTKIKYRMSVTNGSDPELEGEIPVYGSGALSFKTCGEYKDGPAVLLGRKGTIETPNYITGKYWNVDTAFDVKPKNKEYDLKYFFYLANCFDYSYYISQTTLPSMTQTDYVNMKIPFPSIDEQEEIVKYLDKKCMALDNIIETKKKQIETLEAHKKTLIFDYVTGNKRVKEAI